MKINKNTNRSTHVIANKSGKSKIPTPVSIATTIKKTNPTKNAFIYYSISLNFTAGYINLCAS